LVWTEREGEADEHRTEEEHGPTHLRLRNRSETSVESDYMIAGACARRHG
jgi:hypothetical protein